MKWKSILIGGVMMLSGCTAIPDIGTRAYVSGQMRSVQIGNTPEQVQYLLNGTPHQVSMLQQGADAYELWEYRIGNFLYAETAMVLFRNQRVMALPRNGQELVKALNSVGLVQAARFWNQS